MTHAIEADYHQAFLLPPSLEDWVPADHPARFIRDFVSALDLGALQFQVEVSETGRPPYAASLLLKVWLYGYFHKIRSSRKLEAACKEQVGLIWLTGLIYPDHNSLWRFWRRNRKALRAVFKQTVQVAWRAGLIGLALHALDGTKIAAVVSNRTAWHREDLEKEKAALEKSVETVMDEVESAETRERGSYSIPETLQDPAKRKAEIEKALKELSEAEQSHLHPAEPEARMMKTSEGIKLGYNAQAVADASSGMIVGEAVTQDASDTGQLTPMLAATEETLGTTAQETVADGGYPSGEQLAEAETQGYNVLTHSGSGEARRREPYHTSRFHYNETADCWTCPEGQTLTYERTKPSRTVHHYAVRVYRCARCDSCRVREQCTQDPKGRTVELSPFHAAVRRQQAKRERPENRIKLRLRKQIIELVFAWIKEHQGFRRWTVRGLDNVRTQWSLLCATINLKKLYGHWRMGGLRLVRA
jgi:transposase